MIKKYFQWKFLSADGLLKEPEAYEKTYDTYRIDGNYTDKQQAENALEEFLKAQEFNYKEYTLIEVYRKL